MERRPWKLNHKYIDTHLLNTVIPEHSENSTPFASNEASPPTLVLDKWLATTKCFQYEFYQEIDEDIELTLQTNPPLCRECYLNKGALFSPGRSHPLRRHLKYEFHIFRINDETPKVLCSICFVIIDPTRPPEICAGCSMVFEYIKSTVSHGHVVVGNTVEIAHTQRATLWNLPC